MKPVYSRAVLAVFFLLFIVSWPAFASQATEFWGTVTVDDKPAPTGSVIVAKINGNERGQITTTVPGGYGGIGPNDVRLVVRPGAGDLSDTDTPEIVFYINGRQAHEIGYFLDGAVQGLELTVGGEIRTINTPMITTPVATPQGSSKVSGTSRDSAESVASRQTAAPRVTGTTVTPVKSQATAVQVYSSRLPTRLPTLKSIPTAASGPLGEVPGVPSLPGGRGWILAAYAGLVVIVVNLILVIAFWLYRRGGKARI